VNFFQHQDNARRSTRHLVLLFSFAVFLLLLLTNSIIIVGLWLFDGNSLKELDPSLTRLESLKYITEYIDLKYIVIITVINLCIIFLEIFITRNKLSGGGKVIAQYLGGQKINHYTNNNNEKRIINIVEEMAIASGSSVPPIYILPEAGINAFAAGFNPSDAVIGISRGAIEVLDRDQLQGVVAHEFSHIYNGDMRLNINLIAVLSGIEFIGNTGHFLIRSFGGLGVRRYRRDYNAVTTTIGLCLIIIGGIGVFFGNLIKAAVSRQREFLADASAVQFTRNPLGISGALKIIGGYQYGSLICAERTHEMSHLFFSNAVKESFYSKFGSFLSTHPPINERVKRIEPNWDGRFIYPVKNQTHMTEAPSKEEQGAEINLDSKNHSIGFADGVVGAVAGVPEVASSTVSSSVLDVVSVDSHKIIKKEDRGIKNSSVASSKPTDIRYLSEAIEHIGESGQQSIHHAKQSLAMIPKTLRDATQTLDGAKALIYLMLLNKDADIQNSQREYLLKNQSVALNHVLEDLSEVFFQCSRAIHFNLLELCVPILRELTQKQYNSFKVHLIVLIKNDNVIELFEWLLHRLVIHYLKPNFVKVRPPKAKYRDLKGLRNECKFLLSHLSYCGENVDSETFQKTFSQGFESLGLGETSIIPMSQLKVEDLNQATYHFSALYPLVKPKLLKACAQCIQADNKITVEQMNILRALSALLDCPMPLLDITLTVMENNN